MRKTATPHKRHFTISTALAVVFSCWMTGPVALAEPEDPKLPKDVSISDRKDGFLMVYGSDGMGVYSSAGVEIIPPKFGRVDYVGDKLFVTTRWREDTTTQECCLINARGVKVSNLPDWTRTDMRQFHEGVLNIGENTDVPYFINKRGKIALRCDNFHRVKDFSCGLAAASYIDREGGWGCYINHQGKIVVGPFKEADCSNFERGQARVTEYLGPGKTRACVADTAGKFILPLEFESISPFGDYYLAKKDGKFFTYDRDGKLIGTFPNNCTDVEWQSWVSNDGWLTCAFDGNGKNGERGRDGAKWGYCDLFGKIQIQPKFAYCQPFVGDRATAQIKSPDGKSISGSIDRKGNWTIDPKAAETPKAKFNAEYANRFSIFADLLSSNNFIGMDKDNLKEFFGDAQPIPEPLQKMMKGTIYYNLTPGAHCGNASRGLEFSFDENNKILGWRVSGGGMHPNEVNPWITENVRVDNVSKGFGLGNLIPKTAK